MFLVNRYPLYPWVSTSPRGMTYRTGGDGPLEYTRETSNSLASSTMQLTDGTLSDNPKQILPSYIGLIKGLVSDNHAKTTR